MPDPTPMRNDAESSSVVNFSQFTAPPSMEKIMTASKDTFEKFKTDAAEQSRQGMEACVRSGSVMAKSAEQYFKTLMGIAQGAAERQSEAFKQLMSCKTLSELTEAQNRIAQDNFEEMMQTATKLSEISIRMATDCMEPINEEVSKSVRKASDTMAA